MPDNAELPEKSQIDSCNRIFYSKANAGAVVSSESPDAKATASDPQGIHGSERRNVSETVELHQIHWLWKETMERLRRLDARVREGKFVDEASEYARWVQFSGLLKLFRQHPQDDPLRVSADDVQRLITDTLWDCELFWKNNPRGPWVSLSELESINHKLDLLAAKLATLSPNSTADTVDSGASSSSSLRVLQGGAS